MSPGSEVVALAGRVEVEILTGGRDEILPGFDADHLRRACTERGE